MPLQKNCTPDALQKKRRHDLWCNSFLFKRPPQQPLPLLTPESSPANAGPLRLSSLETVAPPKPEGS